MTTFNESLDTSTKKLSGWIKDVWPSVYTALNDFLYGVVQFLKDIFLSIFK